MSAVILNGKKLSEEILNKLKEETSALKTKPALSIISAGDNPASKTYINSKLKACKFLGIKADAYHYEKISEAELLNLINKLNVDASVHGILAQLPLPENIDAFKIISAINPLKDADGIHPYNLGLLMHNKSNLLPCTPSGIIEILKRYNIPLNGKHGVIIGRSLIVGKPLGIMLLNNDATITYCHTKTKNLSEITQKADILVAAAGKPKLVTAEMIKPGSCIIDVGTNLVGGKLCGDVDFERAKEKAGYITPVPGGIGPMTVAMLMQNTLKAYKNLKEKIRD